jgi:quercetin dioxygenase-like cupin family protein
VGQADKLEAQPESPSAQTIRLEQALQRAAPRPIGAVAAGFRFFEDPTAYLGKLHAHVTDLQPGAGYPAHEDKYDVAILVFSGSVETLGKRVGPGGSIYYAAGEPHGMRNAGDQPARYLVFEFHGPKRA